MPLSIPSLYIFLMFLLGLLINDLCVCVCVCVCDFLRIYKKNT